MSCSKALILQALQTQEKEGMQAAGKLFFFPGWPNLLNHEIQEGSYVVEVGESY